LRKSPLTPARLEANRRNAQKSTGPRTALGKSQSRLNGVRNGGRSRLYRDLLLALADAPPGAVIQTARAALTPAQARHPLFAELVEIFRLAESDVALWCRRMLPPQDS
jgi:predicted membrane metal-binding protein